MSFGSRLRERREALGLKQGELGKMLNITGSAIGNYENGISFPKADVLYKVFDVLQCDANFLFQDEMKKSADPCGSTLEKHLLNTFEQLNDEGKEKVVDYADDLIATGRYIKIHSAGLDQKAE